MAWTTRVPPESAMQHYTLEVEDIGEVVWSRNGQEDGRHMGYSLFLEQAKPEALQKFALAGVQKDWLPFHRDLPLKADDIELWNAQTPATLLVSTYEGMVVGLQYEGDTWLGREQWAHALRIKQANLAGGAGAALLLAIGLYAYGRHQRAKHAQLWEALENHSQQQG